MIETNEGFSSRNDEDVNLISENTDGQLKKGDTVTVQGTTFTKEEIEAANKPQPNVILSTLDGANTKTNRDNERVNDRANEAPDSTDSNSGGLSAGGGKGVNQS